MNNRKTKSLNKNVQIKDSKMMYTQPFQQGPSQYIAGFERVDRINAHDLFSLYTAEIINEDTIFTR